MMSMWAIVLFVAASVSAQTEDEMRSALENPDLFQGDILGFDPDERNAHSDLRYRWKSGRIPYVIDSSLANYTKLIREAMYEYHRHTCVRFIPRTFHKNYIRLTAGNEGCSSHVGMVGIGEQLVNLGKGCMVKGTIIHELGHAVGFFHEHMRSDRDRYVYIIYKNMQDDAAPQFVKLAPRQNLLLTPFDYDSIMMYGNFAFSKDGLSPTILAKNRQLLHEPYDKLGLTKSDIKRVNLMYSCGDPRME